MIILDTNILKSTSLRGPAADVLRAIRAADGERVAVPWIVMEEIAAQEALTYQRKHDAAVEAVETLRKATPWSDVPHPRKWPAERVREHWRERYASLAETIETSPAAYQAAMFRETNLIAPCKTVNSGKHKTGARDAAIWLTAVEYARANPAETVYFVSNNTEDFGDGSSFPDPMNKDIAGMEDRFFLFTSLDGILTKFATELKADAEDVQSLLSTEETQVAILLAARAAGRGYSSVVGSRIALASRNTNLDTDRLHDTRRPRWRPEAAALDKVLEVSAREVGGHRWFTASVRWLLREEEVRIGAYSRMSLAYAWETRVLLSPTADKPLTVLDSKRPEPISYADIPKLPDTDNKRIAVKLVTPEVADWLTSPPEVRANLRRIFRRAAPDLTPIEAEICRILDSGPRDQAEREHLLELLSEISNDDPGEEI